MINKCERCEHKFPFPPLRGKVGMGGERFEDVSSPLVSSPVEGEKGIFGRLPAETV